jgi:hypothetical protein
VSKAAKMCCHLGIKIFNRIPKARLHSYPSIMIVLEQQVLIPCNNKEPMMGLSLDALMKFGNYKKTLKERIFPSKVGHINDLILCIIDNGIRAEIDLIWKKYKAFENLETKG